MSTHSSSRRSGSALLTMLLVMAALGSLMLFIFRDSLSATRQLSAASDAATAEAAANAGIDEGLLRLSTGNGLVGGEYGYGAVANQTVSAGNYSLIPFVRGYTAGCTDLTAPQPLANNLGPIVASCPEYQLAIRTSARILPSPSTAFNRYAIGPNLLPVGVAVSFPIPKPTGGFFTLGLDSSSQGADIAIQWLDKNGGIAQAGEMNLATPTSTSPIGSKGFILTAKQAFAGRGVVIQSNTAGNFVVSTGATTIIATGVFNGIERSRIVTIPAYTIAAGHPRPVFSQFSGSFDSTGLPQ